MNSKKYYKILRPQHVFVFLWPLYLLGGLKAEGTDYNMDVHISNW